MLSQSQKLIDMIERAFADLEVEPVKSDLLQEVETEVATDHRLALNIAQYYAEVSPPPDRLISALFFLFDLTLDGRFLSQLSEIAASMTSPALFYELFWNIGRRRFERGGVFDGRPMRKGAARLASSVNAVVNRRTKLRKSPVGDICKVAIVSPQILGVHHSPTREAVSIALHLKHNHGCEAVIIDTAGMSYTNTLALRHPFIANTVDGPLGICKLSHLHVMDFHDDEVMLVRFPFGPMSTRKIITILDLLAALKIDGVVAHGENLLVQEAIFGKLPSVFATTGSVVPMAHSDAYFVPEHLWSAEAAMTADLFGHRDFMMESMLVTPEPKNAEPANRAQWGIPDDAIIYLVVSTRMATELTSEFVEGCKTILKAHPSFHLLLVGAEGYNAKGIFGEMFFETGQIHNLGFQSDLFAVCAMADVYLNPFREGGGTSSQTAMQNGLPVVTLDQGHISAIVQMSDRHQNVADYFEYAEKLGQDSEFLKKEQSRFRNYFNTSLDPAVQIKKIYNKLCAVAQKKYSSGECTNNTNEY